MSRSRTAPPTPPALRLPDFKRIRRASAGLLAFAKEYFPDRCQAPWSRFHLDFAADLDDPTADLVAYMGPREFGKTTLGSTIFGIREALCNPAVKLILLAQVDITLAQLDLESIKRQLAKNEALRQDWGGELLVEGGKESERAIDVRKFGNRDGEPGGSCRIMCVSPSVAIMGANLDTRPNLIILMDPQRVSPAKMSDPGQVQKFEEWFEGDLMGSRAPGGRMVLCANALDERSYISKRCAGMPYTAPDGSRYGRTDEARANLPINRRWRRGKFAVEVTGHPTIPDGTPLWDVGEERAPDGRYTWELDPNAGGWPRSRIARRKEECSARVWALHHMNETSTDVERIFKVLPTFGPRVEDGADARRRWPGCRIMAHVDRATSLRESADQTAVAIAASLTGDIHAGKFGVLYCEARRLPLMEAIEWIWHVLFPRWGFDGLQVEVNGGHRDFYSAVIDWAHRWAIHVPMDEITRKTNDNKDERIEGAEPYFRQGLYMLAEDDWETRSTLEEHCRAAPLKDKADAIESALTYVRTKSVVASVAVGAPGDAKQREREWRERMARGYGGVVAGGRK